MVLLYIMLLDLHVYGWKEYIDASQREQVPRRWQILPVQMEAVLRRSVHHWKATG